MVTLDDLTHEQLLATAKAFEMTMLGELIESPMWDQMGKDGMQYYVDVMEKWRNKNNVR